MIHEPVEAEEMDIILASLNVFLAWAAPSLFPLSQESISTYVSSLNPYGDLVR